MKCNHHDLQLPEFWEVHEGLWVNLVERVPLEVELHQLGTLLEETGARDAGYPVLAEEPGIGELKNENIYVTSTFYMNFGVAPLFAPSV